MRAAHDAISLSPQIDKEEMKGGSAIQLANPPETTSLVTHTTLTHAYTSMPRRRNNGEIAAVLVNIAYLFCPISFDATECRGDFFNPFEVKNAAF